VSDIFVIIGTTGEWSDRYESHVGYVNSEEDAHALVKLAEYQKSNPYNCQRPKGIPTHNWRLPDGTIPQISMLLYLRNKGAKFVAEPNTDEITAINNKAIADWMDAKRAAGYVDVDGPCDSYHYERVSLLTVPKP